MVEGRGSYYARRKLAENPDCQFRETANHSPRRWTEEHLTETWAERKQRLAMERGRCG